MRRLLPLLLLFCFLGARAQSRFQPDERAYYGLINRGSGRCLDVARASTASGAPLVQWEFTHTPNQQWRLVPVQAGGEYYRLEARYSGLVSSGAVSQSAYDQAKAAADSARALLSAAEAQLKVAEDEGAYATLVADADGTVMETLAEPGQFISAGQTVVRVARAGAREAAVNLPETLRPALGSTAHAILYGANADSATRYPAHLRQLSEAADPLTRTFEARYVLEGTAARAPLGATITVYLNESEQAGALSVPLGAIDDEGRGPGVWLLDRQSSSVSYRSVRFIRFDGESAIVSGGIHSGDPIIAVGGHFLHEAQRVQVADARVTRD